MLRSIDSGMNLLGDKYGGMMLKRSARDQSKEYIILEPVYTPRAVFQCWAEDHWTVNQSRSSLMTSGISFSKQIHSPLFAQ